MVARWWLTARLVGVLLSCHAFKNACDHIEATPLITADIDMIEFSPQSRAWYQPVLDFWAHEPLTLAASIAFYSSLSFAPIVVLAIWAIANLAPGSEVRLVAELRDVFGIHVGAVAQLVVDHADTSSLRFDRAGLLALVTLIASTTTAFAQFQTALNRVWGSSAPASAIGGWIRERLLSLGIVTVLVFLLLVALVASSTLALVLTREGWWWSVVNELATLTVFSGAFAAMFRYVPDTRPPWRGAIAGGIVTAILFEGGKWMLSAWLGHGIRADAYGGAGTIVMLLVWVYYSALIVLVGAAIAREVMLWRRWWPTLVAAASSDTGRT